MADLLDLIGLVGVIDERRGGSALYEEPERLLVFVDGPSKDLLPLEILYHFLGERFDDADASRVEHHSEAFFLLFLGPVALGSKTIQAFCCRGVSERCGWSGLAGLVRRGRWFAVARTRWPFRMRV